MRFGVEPGELHAAAARVHRVSDRTRAARDTLNRIDDSLGSWCPDQGLMTIVRDALDALELAAHAAGEAASDTASGLVAAAENYARADAPVPR